MVYSRVRVRVNASVKTFASFKSLISVAKLKLLAGEEDGTREKEQTGACVCVCVHLRACVCELRFRTSRGEKGAKSCERSRTVGQMFKQTSNYLNSIWDLRGVPALESSIAPLPFISFSVFRLFGSSVLLPVRSRSVRLSLPLVFRALRPKMSSAPGPT